MAWRAPVLGLLLAVVATCTEAESYECTEDESLELYARRIEPLLTDDRPKTCNQCHLSGIDLGMFVQETPCGTMACLVDKGLVDLESPADSAILGWIARADPASELITEEVVQEEYDAFLGWIEYNSQCGAEVCEPIEDPCGEPPGANDCEIPPLSEEQRPVDDPSGCDDLTLEMIFREKVYEWRGRCYACHFDSYDGPPEDAPRWVATGECDVGSLATMRNVESRGLIDVDAPEQSLLLLKPLHEDAGGMEHGGHHKFETRQDPGYQDFLYWVERYAACEG